MKFQFTVSLLATITSALANPAPKSLSTRAYGGPPSTGEVCPQAQDLYFHSTNNHYYQIACSVDTSGDVNVAAYTGVTNVIDCANRCDIWNAIAATSPKCGTATYYTTPLAGGNNCVLREGIFAYAFTPAAGAETAFLS